MKNCIIIDDEPLARQLVAAYIEQLPELQLAGSYSSALEAFTALHSQQIDVMFLDIEMPGITGINFVKSLKSPPRVVFISAHAEFAVEAFELEAIDYLVKPVTFERFLKTVHKIVNPGLKTTDTAPREASNIFLKVDKRLIKIELAEILYIEGLGDYLKVHTPKKTHVTYMTFGKLETLLPGSRFIRIHRSILINTDWIQYIEGNFVRVDDKELSIGITYRDAFLKRLNDLQ